MAKCDRCGKEHNNEVFPSVHVTIIYPQSTQTPNTIVLCSECQEELLAWIEKGVKEND